MTQTNEIPVLLLTGYLGSGKTTLLNRILNNEKGYRFAVIVNDLGEVNIDADLIQKGGVVGQDDKSGDLIALQNGCICCSLQTDLIKQLSDLSTSGHFDYIVIEASGICDPAPIARTIAMMPRINPELRKEGLPVLDSIVTVVDALRLASEFNLGADLLAERDKSEEEKEGSLTALVVDQIEFCNTVIINKISEITPEQAKRLHDIIRALQPTARILACDYCDIPLEEILGTGEFDFEAVATSAAWVQGVEGPNEMHEHHHHDDDEHHDERHRDHHGDDRRHDHHHHEHGDHDHAAEYGISTFVYFRRKPFDLNKFDYMIGKDWPRNIIRSKGVLYFSNNLEMSYLFEQAGVQTNLRQAGYWCATAPADELAEMMRNDPQLRRDWDDVYGDRMVKLVIIGQNLDHEAIVRKLDDCLAD